LVGVTLPGIWNFEKYEVNPAIQVLKTELNLGDFQVLKKYPNLRCLECDFDPIVDSSGFTQEDTVNLKVFKTSSVVPSIFAHLEELDIKFGKLADLYDFVFHKMSRLTKLNRLVISVALGSFSSASEFVACDETAALLQLLEVNLLLSGHSVDRSKIITSRYMLPADMNPNDLDSVEDANEYETTSK
jgi:hypothetical protein